VALACIVIVWVLLGRTVRRQVLPAAVEDTSCARNQLPLTCVNTSLTAALVVTVNITLSPIKYSVRSLVTLLIVLLPTVLDVVEPPPSPPWVVPVTVTGMLTVAALLTLLTELANTRNICVDAGATETVQFF
jgi:hypothetical protein